MTPSLIAINMLTLSSVINVITDYYTTTIITVISEILFGDTPKFSDRMDNLTITVGRDAILECVVESLSTYKVSLYVVLKILNYIKKKYLFILRMALIYYQIYTHENTCHEYACIYFVLAVSQF